MTNENPPTPFIAIEGLDGAGTTTQAGLLVERLREGGLPALLTREPSDGPIGALIRQMLSGRVVAPAAAASEEGDASGAGGAVGREVLALLFAADRLDHLSAEVEPARQEGRVVVTDRYYHSSFAYQGDPAGEGGESGELDLRWVRTLNERARRPDLTVFLEADVELCLQRLQTRGRRDIFETRERLEDLHGRYEHVIAALEAEGHAILRLDASRTREELAERIYEAVANAANRKL